MSIQVFQQKIYLVAEATNCGDIYNTIMEDSRKYNVSTEGLEKEKYPKLDDLGIKELFLLMRNTGINNLLGIKNPSAINPHILTVMESQAIEMGLVLYNEVSNVHTIYPVPFLSANSGVYNTASLDKLKEVFGGKYNTKKYWERRELLPNINKYLTSLKDKVPKISWSFTNEKIKFEEMSNSGVIKEVNKTISRGSLNGFMFNKFQDNILYPLIRETIDNSVYSGLENSVCYDNESCKALKPIVMMANFDTIRSFIDQVKNKKYNKKDHKIERSSVWEIEIKVTKKVDYGKLNYKFEYINHTKRYPTEFISKNLLKNDDTFKIKFRGKQFEMYDINKKIPITSVVDMDCKHCKESKIMKKILKEVSDKIKEEKGNNQNNKNKNEIPGKNLKITKNIRNFREAINVLTNE